MRQDIRNTGAALAMLTVTEATIYGRYGYAPAAKAATVTVDRRRVHWVGPDAPGRVQFVSAADLREAAPAIARRAVARTPGEIDRWPGILDRALGLVDAQLGAEPEWHWPHAMPRADDGARARPSRGRGRADGGGLVVGYGARRTPSPRWAAARR